MFGGGMRIITSMLFIALFGGHAIAAQSVPDPRSTFGGRWEQFDPLCPESRVALTLVQSGSALEGRYLLVADSRQQEGVARGTVLAPRARVEWILPAAGGSEDVVLTFVAVLEDD